jgi:hypothetical protein
MFKKMTAEFRTIKLIGNRQNTFQSLYTRTISYTHEHHLTKPVLLLSRHFIQEPESSATALQPLDFQLVPNFHDLIATKTQKPTEICSDWNTIYRCQSVICPTRCSPYSSKPLHRDPRGSTANNVKGRTIYKHYKRNGTLLFIITTHKCIIAST